MQSYTLFLTFILSLCPGLCKSASIDFAHAPEWPQKITYSADINVTAAQCPEHKNRLIYQTDNFKLISEVPLTQSAVCQAIETMEATLASWQALPLGVEITTDELPRVVKLIASEDRFTEISGFRGAGGIYLPETKEALINTDHLKPEYSEEGHIKSFRNTAIIAHEVTHQLQSTILNDLPTWLVEGLAMYLEAIPYHDGVYHFDQPDFRNSPGIRRCTQNTYQLISLEQLTQMTRYEWNHRFDTNPESNERYYLSAFLLTYYFIHLNAQQPGTEMKKLINDYLSSSMEAPPSHKTGMNKLLGNPLLAVQEDLQAAYRKHDFNIHILPQPH